MARRNPTESDTFAPTPAQVRAAQSLATGAADAEAAREAGIHRSTLYDWRKTPEFVALCTAMQREFACRLWAERYRRALKLVDLAMTVIEGTMADADAPPGVRLRAAELALERFWDTYPKAHVDEITDPEQLARDWGEGDRVAFDPFTSRSFVGRSESPGSLDFRAAIARVQDRDQPGTPHAEPLGDGAEDAATGRRTRPRGEVARHARNGVCHAAPCHGRRNGRDRDDAT